MRCPTISALDSRRLRSRVVPAVSVPSRSASRRGLETPPKDVDQRSGLLGREVMDLKTLVQPGSDDTREPEDQAHRFHPRGWQVVSLLGQSLSRLRQSRHR